MKVSPKNHMGQSKLVEPERERNRLPSEMYVSQTMPSIFGSFDMLAMFVCALLLVGNVVAGSTNGLASLTIMGVGCIVFFVPCIIATAQLGTMLPYEGSLSTWTYQALGGSWSLFSGLCFWLTGMLVVTIGAQTFVELLQGQNSSWLTEPWQQGLTILVIIAVAGALGLQRARTVHYVINGLILLGLVAVLMIGAAAVVWLARGHASMTSLSHFAWWSVPSGNFARFGLGALAFLGVFWPLNMAGEIRTTGNRTKRGIITGHLLWGPLTVLASYLLTTFAVLTVLGPASPSAAFLPFGGVTAVRMAMGNVAGGIAVVCTGAACLAFVFFYSSASARTLMVLGIDQRLSTQFAALSRNRVPAKAITFQTLIASLWTVVAFIAAPYLPLFGGNPTNRLIEIHAVVVATVMVVWVITTLFLFVTLSFLYRRYPHQLRQQRLLPMPVIWGSVLLGSFACVVAIGGILSSSWVPQLIANSLWALFVCGFTCVFLAIVAVWTTSQMRDWEEVTE